MLTTPRPSRNDWDEASVVEKSLAGRRASVLLCVVRRDNARKSSWFVEAGRSRVTTDREAQESDLIASGTQAEARAAWSFALALP